MSDRATSLFDDPLGGQETSADATPRSLLVRLIENAAAVLMLALVVLVLANALGRYFAARPLPWTEEVATSVLVWLAAVGIVIGAIRGSLITCEILTRRVSDRARRRVGIGGSVFGVAVLLLFGWYAWQYLGFFGRDVSPILQIPKGVPIAGLFAACVGLAAALLLSVFRKREG